MKSLCLTALAFLTVSGASAGTCADTNDITVILRQSVRQLQKLGRNGTITPETAPRSNYGSPTGGRPTFESRCMEVNGRFRYWCAYRMNAEAECLWQERVRKLGDLRTFADFDHAESWTLLARTTLSYSYEDVLKVLGKPCCSRMLQCRRCGRKDMRWEYAILGVDDYGDAMHHTLAFSFAENGQCAGWTWQSE